MVLEALGGLIHNWVAAYGLAGLFLASVIGNATLFLPLPVTVITCGLGAKAAVDGAGLLFVLLIGLASGLGAAVGELSGYAVGWLGRDHVHKLHPSLDKKKLAEIEFKLHRYGAWIVLGGSLVPFPFDIIGIGAGLLKMDVKTFFFATAVGKTVRDSVIALAGFYGFELIKAVFVF